MLHRKCTSMQIYRAILPVQFLAEAVLRILLRFFSPPSQRLLFFFEYCDRLFQCCGVGLPATEDMVGPRGSRSRTGPCCRVLFFQNNTSLLGLYPHDGFEGFPLQVVFRIASFVIYRFH